MSAAISSRSCCWTSCSRVCWGRPSCWMSGALISPPSCLLMASSLDRSAWKKASEEILAPPTLARVSDRLVSPRRPAPPQMAKIATMNVATMSQRMGLSDLTLRLMVFSMGSPRRGRSPALGRARAPAASPLFVEQGTQLLIGRVQVLDEDPRAPDEGHEIGVSRPARDDMEMVVPGDAGPGARPEVHAGVEALGRVGPAQDPERGREELGHLGPLVWGGLREIRQVPLGRDHEMAGRVGEPVEQDEIAPPAQEHGRGPVVAALQGLAENAALGDGRSADVVGPPGGGDVAHYLLISSLRSLLGLK